MASNVSNASQSLLLLRANTISSFTEDSNEAEICNLMYEEHIRQLLGIYPWTFATKQRQLNQDTTKPIKEYNFSYIIPAEALLIWAVANSSNVNALPTREHDIFINNDESSRRIFSNHSMLFADYIVRPDENVWPPYFSLFAINSFAAYIAIPVTGDKELAALYDKIAYGSVNANRKGGLFGIAASTDAKQKRNEVIVSSPIIEARFS